MNLTFNAIDQYEVIISFKIYIQDTNFVGDKLT